MEQNVFVCFSSKQVKFVSWLIQKGLVNPVACANIEHPLTGQIEMQIQKYETVKIISKCSQWVLALLIGVEGKIRLQRMEHCGMVQQISSLDERFNSAQKIIFRV